MYVILLRLLADVHSNRTQCNLDFLIFFSGMCRKLPIIIEKTAKAELQGGINN